MVASTGGSLPVDSMVSLKRSRRLECVLDLLDALGRVEIVRDAILEGGGAAGASHALRCRLLDAARWFVRDGGAIIVKGSAIDTTLRLLPTALFHNKLLLVSC